MKVKSTLKILLVLLIVGFSFLLVSCGDSTEGSNGDKGDTGNGISSISLTETNGLEDTYTITFTDGTTKTFIVTNGKDGVDGKEGIQGIQGEPGKDGHTPVITIVDGNWYIDGVDTLQAALGIKGDTGNGISSISLTETNGLEDTYTITFTDGTTKTFIVTNGKDGVDGKEGIQGIQGEPGKDGHTPVITIVDGNWYIDGVDTLQAALGIKGDTGNGISSISLTETNGLEDTYTITFTDGTTKTFIVTNGKDGVDGKEGIQGIQGEPGLDGHSPVITIVDGNWYIDGVDTLQAALGIKGDTGNGISSISLTETNGLEDTYTITFTDGTTKTFVVTNGKDGVDGKEGIQGIQGEPGKDGHSPVITIVDGNWYIDGVDTLQAALGIKGDTGNGISSISLTETNGLEDTYTITFTDGTTKTFVVTNGKDGVDGKEGIQGIQGEPGKDGHTPVITIGENGNWYIDGVDTLQAALGIKGDTGNGISSISLTETNGLEDTYTITFTDGTTKTFIVTNGKDGVDGKEGIQGIQGEPGLDGHSPVITIVDGNWYIDGVDTLQAALGIKGDTGNGISSISLTETNGLEDTYTITFTDGTTKTFIVTNGKDGVDGKEGIQGIQGEPGKDGHSPVITIVDGNWYIDGVDTLQAALGIKGDTGNGISSISLTETNGLEDTYTITFTDGTTKTFVVTNGKDGVDGKEGIQGIQGEPGLDGHSPVITIENGNWYIDGVDTLQAALGIKGDTGNGISSISLTETNGLEDTYTITFTDGTTKTFIVTNGKDGVDGKEGIQGIQGEPGKDGHSPVITIVDGNWYIDGVDTLQAALGIKGDTGNGISSISLTETNGLEDTYTITFTDGTTKTFVVTNGKDGVDGKEGIQGIQGEPGLDGHSPVITIENGNWYIDGVDTLQAALGIKGDTGNGISSISLTESSGLEDTYTITFTDGTTKTFIVTNGKDGVDGKDGLDGTHGKSAYEIYKEKNPEYAKSESDWLDDLINGRLGTEEPIYFTIIFDSDGGSLISEQNILELSKITKPNDPTKEGYKFIGWFIEDEQWIFNGFLVTEDITLIAKWEKIIVLDVEFSNQTFTYDGSPKVLSIVGTLPEGVVVTYTNNGKVNAGIYTVVAKFVDVTGTLLNIPNLEATLTINQAVIDNISLNDKSYIYDKTSKSLEIEGILPEGVTVSYTNNNKTNAGTYEITAVFSYANNNYIPLPDLEATLTINKAIHDLSNVSLNSKTFVYDGLSKSLEIEGILPEGVTVSYTNNNQTNVGNHLVIASFEYDNSNYEEILPLEAYLNIIEAEIIGISFSSQTYTYDGSVKSLEIEGTLPDGVTVSYTNNSHINAGTYEVTAIFNDSTGNYESLPNLTATLTINKATFTTPTLSSQTYTYDGTSKELLISGTLPEGVSISYTNNNRTNAGIYNVTASFSDINNNYVLPSNLTATLTINKAVYDMSNITFEDKLFIYDETEKEITINGTLPIGVTVEYLPSNKLTNVGILDITTNFIYDEDNYEHIENLTATLTIIEAGARLDTPIIDFDGEFINWTKDPKASYYLLEINGIEYTSTGTFYYLDELLNDKDGFVVRMKVISNDENYHDSLYSNVITKLPAVENIELNYGIISWDDVKDNQGYELKINTTTIYIDDNYLDLKEYTNGSYTIVINVLGTEGVYDFFNSEKEQTIVNKNTLLNLRKEDHILKWDEVNNVTSYIIDIDGITQELSTNNYDMLTELRGSHLVKAYAQLDNNFYLSTMNVTKLNDITNFKLEDSLFTWDKVSNADGYFVYINNQRYDNLDNNSFVLDERFDSGEYEVSVRAYASDSNTLLSSYTNIIETTKLSDDITITLVDGVVTWNEIDNASSYYITYGNDIYETEENEIKITNLVGENKFTIYALGDGVSFVNSEIVEQNIIRLTNPILSYEDGLVSWDSISNAASYNVYLDNQVINVGLNTSYNLTNFDNVYTIIIEAVGDYTYLSNQSSYYTNKLNEINVSINSDGISWNKITEATNYIVKINDDTYYLDSTKTVFGLLDLYQAGTYDIKVIAVEENNGYINVSSSNLETFNKLEVVTNIRNEDGFITWDEVTNATSYKVTIGSSTYISNTNLFNADNVIEIGEQEVSVQAINGFSYINSNDSTKVIFEILDAVGSVSINDGVLSWDAVNNAIKYIILVNGIELETTNTTFILDENYEAGAYDIQIRAIGSNSYLSSKYTNVLTLNKLETPGEAWIVDGYLVIDEVPNAKGYRLEINGIEYDYDSNTEFLMPQDITTNVLNIRIKAIGNDVSYVNSEYNQIELFRKLATPEIYFEDNFIKWESSNHSITAGYVLYINEQEINLGQVLEYDVSNSYYTVSGENTFKLRAIGSDDRLSSLETVTITKTKLATPRNVSLNNGVLSWDEVTNANEYKVIVDNNEYITSDASYEIGSINSILSVAVIAIGTDVYLKSNKYTFMWTENGQKYINYGKYPQTVVSDSLLKSALNNLTETNSEGYYKYDGNEYAKLTATPYKSGYEFSDNTTVVDGATYYFKVEPIKWRIISNNDGTLQLLSEYIIDSQYYHPNTNTRTIGGKTIYSNNYEHSYIREWLNNSFYNKAFGTPDQNAILTTLVDNSASTTSSSSNSYASNNTNDKIYLLSYQDSINSNYGFSTSTTRYAVTTDYARAKGAYIDTSTNTYGNGYWWLRSPDSRWSSSAYLVRGGSTDDFTVSVAYSGVRPALQIK